ncbi:hypothetical protein HYW20_03170 [Candidatus Woesearchaeota archaeon]|nr:hypothetical protein [Candidatus Woesearchaeota archaeon]
MPVDTIMLYRMYYPSKEPLYRYTKYHQAVSQGAQWFIPWNQCIKEFRELKEKSVQEENINPIIISGVPNDLRRSENVDEIPQHKLEELLTALESN